MGEETTTERWEDRTRVVLSPISAPSILGLYGFAGATFIVASHMAGWWGTDQDLAVAAPFAALFGGVAQFLAGMWAYRARDAIATAMHGMWGSFWIAFGLLEFLIATGVFSRSQTTVGFGWWFIALAAITAMGALAALSENVVLFGVLGTLAAGATLAAIGLIGGLSGVEAAAGWVFVVSAILAFYLASAMMFAEAAGKVILPLGKYDRDANVPGHKESHPIGYDGGMPGARVGQ
jgi:succinate-acetate transporter protein